MDFEFGICGGDLGIFLNWLDLGYQCSTVV
jgi:hypothetical protein